MYMCIYIYIYIYRSVFWLSGAAAAADAKTHRPPVTRVATRRSRLECQKVACFYSAKYLILDHVFLRTPTRFKCVVLLSRCCMLYRV